LPVEPLVASSTARSGLRPPFRRGPGAARPCAVVRVRGVAGRRLAVRAEGRPPAGSARPGRRGPRARGTGRATPPPGPAVKAPRYRRMLGTSIECAGKEDAGRERAEAGRPPPRTLARRSAPADRPRRRQRRSALAPGCRRKSGNKASLCEKKPSRLPGRRSQARRLTGRGPPSTPSTWPVTKAASSLTRNRTTGRRPAGSPNRPRGVRRSTPLDDLVALACRQVGCGSPPAPPAFDPDCRTGPSSRAAERAAPATADFAAAYAVCPTAPVLPAIGAEQHDRPRALAAHDLGGPPAGSRACPETLVAIMRSTCSRVIIPIGAASRVPAAATRASMRAVALRRAPEGRLQQRPRR